MTAPDRAALGERAARALSAWGKGDGFDKLHALIVEWGVVETALEREACAQVCDAGVRDECSPTYLAASIRARGAESKTHGSGTLGRTLFECRTCDRVIPGWTDGHMDDSSWARIDHIDGRNAICPSCQGDDTALDGLRESYPNAVARGTESKTGD